MGDAEVRPQHPIGTVARRTGLTAHVLRAWERRYGVVTPQRSEGGVRLYSNADIVRLRLLRQLTAAGHAISRVAALSVEELVALARETGLVEAEREPREPARPTDAFVAACLAAVEAMDGSAIHRTLMRAAVSLSPTEFAEDVAVPVLRQVGDLWISGDVCPAHEHLLSVCVQRVLNWLLGSLPSESTAPLLLATTPSGERHELGAMLAGVVAADAGWRVVYFGPDLPTEDIARAVETTGADAVALSLVHGTRVPMLQDQLRDLRRRIPASVQVLLGGAGAAEHADLMAEVGARGFNDLRSLRRALADSL